MPFQHPSLFYRDLPLRYVRDPRLGHRLGRNYPDGVHVDETWGYKWLGTNANGFYGQESAIEWGPPKPNTRRILLMGGSAAMGLGASRRGQTIRDHLERLLREPGERQVEVINGAVGDYGSSQSLLYFVTELIVLKPDIVVVIDGFNDACHSIWGTKYSSGEWLPNTSRSFDDNVEGVMTWDQSIPADAVRALRRRRSSGAIRREKSRQLKSGRLYANSASTHGYVWDDPTLWSVKQSGISWYLQNARTMAALCAGLKISLLHVIQPATVWPSPNTHGVEELEILGYFNERLPGLVSLLMDFYQALEPQYQALADSVSNSDVGTRGAIRFLDGTRMLVDRRRQLYFDAMHYNDEGQEAVAKFLAHELDSSGSIG